MIQQMTLSELEEKFATEEACKDYLVAYRWPCGVCCPRCGASEPYELQSRPYHWQCPRCADTGYRFSVLVGTIFENTHISLPKWFQAIHLMLLSKKRVNAHQIFHLLGFGSYRTARQMCQRIRSGMQDKDFQRLMGIVQADEGLIFFPLAQQPRKIH